MDVKPLQRCSSYAISLVYLTVSAGWVAGSDYLISLLPGDGVSQTLKGLLFVSVTALLLQRLLEREERKTAEYVARMAEGERLRAIGDVAARLSHDLRNVLMAATTMLTVLRKFTVDCPQSEAASRRLHATLSRGSAMLSEVLGYAAAKPARCESIELDEWLTRFVDESLPLLGERISLTAAVGGAGLSVTADPMQLHRLLTNLVLNAVEAMPGGGSITIDAEARDATVSIEVRDTGVGMPPEVLRHAFDPLFSTKSKGTGLGLASAASIAAAHGGTITCDSVPGRGSTFRIVLPSSPAMQRAA